jgi:hypothetical protein
VRLELFLPFLQVGVVQGTMHPLPNVLAVAVLEQ